MTEVAGHAPTAANGVIVRAAGAGAAGNVLEWFDFAVYGYMAPMIAPLFFPSTDPLSAILAVYGAFAAGYLARPIGAMIFGHLGDHFGRKPMLVASVLMMGLSTVSIALLPTFQTVGPIAGALLVVLRILQGLSVGGEYTGSTVFVAEHAPPARRGFFCAWITGGAIGGFLLGSLAVALLSTMFDEATIKAGLWRLPFLCGLLIVIAALVLRRSVSDAPGPSHGEPVQHPVPHAFRHSWREILKVGAIALGASAVPFYILFVYAATFLQERLHVSTTMAMDINTIALCILFVVPFLSGALSDRIRARRPVLITGFALMVLLCVPLWALMHTAEPIRVVAAQAGFALIVGITAGVAPVIMTEIASTRTRVTVLSIGYNVTLALFGGTAPIVAAYLIARTADDYMPAYYILATSAVSLVVAVFFLRVPGPKPAPG
ncbi:MFS transporter [Acuticoccus mangrovi]|uniref:MFS transporter n=1 Tax=Acuticoccus mangrovi TaxID=2796142 RepID=A0A934MFN4_9HYPH|nr:MFS transporter [Acuticoccus mangrovi]MBJ3775663.1 MFS transporter [Acuticoccus mangrovi]